MAQICVIELGRHSNRNFIIFIKKIFQIVIFQNGSHFVQGEMSYGKEVLAMICQVPYVSRDPVYVMGRLSYGTGVISFDFDHLLTMCYIVRDILRSLFPVTFDAYIVSILNLWNNQCKQRVMCFVHSMWQWQRISPIVESTRTMRMSHEVL